MVALNETTPKTARRRETVDGPTVQVMVDEPTSGLAGEYLARMGESSWVGYVTTQTVFTVAQRRRGATGLLLRRVLYPRILGSARRPVIGEDTIIRGARHVHLGDGVIIESGVLLDVKTSRTDGLVVGDRTQLRWGARIDTGFSGFVHMGAECVLAGELLGAGEIEVGDHALIARGATVVSANHRWIDPEVPIIDQGVEAARVCVGNDAWVATGAVVLPGIDIGDGAVVAANAVVNEHVPAYAVVAGAPARVVRMRRVDDVPARANLSQ